MRAEVRCRVPGRSAGWPTVLVELADTVLLLAEEEITDPSILARLSRLS